MPSIFGLDIGAFDMKGVELKHGKDNSRLISFGRTSSPVNLNVAETDKDILSMAKALKGFIRTHGFGNHVVSCVPDSQLFSLVIELPRMTERELHKSINFEAEQYIPLPLDEVSLDYQIIENPDSNTTSMQVLLIAVPKRVVNKYFKVIEKAGLEPIAIETQTAAILRALAINVQTDTPSIIVNIGATSTDISIVKNGIMRFSRSVPTGGGAFTRAISQDLKFELVQAEQYKRTYGLDETKLEGKIVSALLPVLSVITSEMRRAVQYYNSKQEDKVKKVLLVGGSAKLPNLLSFLAREMGMEVEVASPFNNIEFPPEKELNTEDLRNNAGSYVVATGLAMKKIEL